MKKRNENVPDKLQPVSTFIFFYRQFNFMIQIYIYFFSICF